MHCSSFQLRLILIGLLINVYSAQAGLIYSNGSGFWTNASTWLKNGVPALPTCGDTIVIQAGHTVTENAHLDYTACSLLNIYIDGTLQFTNGNKLELPCGSFVSIRPGGLVKKATAGGGNSTFIDICGVAFWNAGMGSLSGPVYLPVSLLYFNAKADKDEVAVSWATAAETDNDYFLVERSTDGETFTTVTKIKGAGNSNVMRNYSTIDNLPAQGINYYRLCQVDYNGSKHFFKPIAVSMNAKGTLMVYPNPASADNISIVFDGTNEANCSVAISDLNGKIIFFADNFLMKTGENKLTISNTNFFNAGVYLLSATVGNKTLQSKLVIK